MERKYKLMLVDDEPWALTGIEEIIDWEAEGFTVVARCGCGRDGILAAQIHQPDAVVTDIGGGYVMDDYIYEYAL